MANTRTKRLPSTGLIAMVLLKLHLGVASQLPPPSGAQPLAQLLRPECATIFEGLPSYYSRDGANKEGGSLVVDPPMLSDLEGEIRKRSSCFEVVASINHVSHISIREWNLNKWETRSENAHFLYCPSFSCLNSSLETCLISQDFLLIEFWLTKSDFTRYVPVVTINILFYSYSKNTKKERCWKQGMWDIFICQKAGMTH